MVIPDLPRGAEVGRDGKALAVAIRERVGYINRLYRSGKPLFPRELLADLDRQIDDGNEEIHIVDLEGVGQTYSRSVPGWCTDFANTYRISYHSIQSLTCVHPSFPELILRDRAPVSIGYTSAWEPCKTTLNDVRDVFLAKRQDWRTSATCQGLLQHLSSMEMRARITKIVCFGLGTLGAINGCHSTRCHAQHAAVETIATALARRGVSGGHEIQCFAQDPAYDSVDQALLRELGIYLLDDPKGFLEIDDETLVFSVSPNVPVKQIVVDVQWPAAMIWNTVVAEEKEDTRWVKRTEENGGISWMCPFTTDPDSMRVRSMVKKYSQETLQDPNEFFGDLTIYMRGPT